MKNVQELDQAFERTQRFLRACRHPGARALAAARMLESLPGRFLGESFYESEMQDALAEALGSPGFEAADPEVRARIERARVRYGLPAPTGPGDSADAIPQSGDRHRRDGRRAELIVPIPLVLTLPHLGPQGDGAPLGVAATVAPLRISPRPWHKTRPRIRWTSDGAVRDDGRYRPLEEVSRQAWSAAQSAVAACTGAAPGTRRSDPAFEVSFADPTVLAAGDSLGLGLAAALAGCTLGTRRRGRGLRPRHGLAWTGVVADDGEIMEVEADHLRAKVRQAFYSGLSGIVVPASQEEAARAEIPEEAVPSPAIPGEAIAGEAITNQAGAGRAIASPPAAGRAIRGRFAVIGVGHLVQALHDPRLFEGWTVPRSAYRALVRSRTEAVAAALLGMISVAAAALVASAIVRAERLRGPLIVPGGRAELLRLRYAGGAPERQILAPGAISYSAIARALDDGHGRGARLVVASAVSDSTPGMLQVFDPSSGRLEWEYRLDRLPLAPRLLATRPDAIMNAIGGICADLDSDGREEIVVSASTHPYSTCVLLLFDGDRRPKGVWVHPGHVSFFAAADLDGDGRVELAGMATNNRMRSLGLVLLHPEHFDPIDQAVSPEHDLRRQRCLTYVVIPTPDEVREATGMEHIGNSGVTLIPRDGKPPMVAAETNASTAINVDYHFVFSVPVRLVATMVNACMRERADLWLRQGKTKVDLASSSFVERWENDLRCLECVPWDTTDAGRPVLREEPRASTAPPVAQALRATAASQAPQPPQTPQASSAPQASQPHPASRTSQVSRVPR